MYIYRDRESMIINDIAQSDHFIFCSVERQGEKMNRLHWNVQQNKR